MRHKFGCRSVSSLGALACLLFISSAGVVFGQDSKGTASAPSEKKTPEEFAAAADEVLGQMSQLRD